MIQRGKCPMCGGTMTEDSTHTLLVCDFCGMIKIKNII